MPRNVRNFWIEADVDGCGSKLSSGPAAKNGGFSLVILMREKGCISNKKVRISGCAFNGKIELDVRAEGESADLHHFRIESER